MASQAPGTPPASAAGPPVPGALPASLDPTFRATSDVECVWVNRSCGVQTLESRFGSTAREVIYSRLERYMDYEEDEEGSDENEDWDDEGEESEDDDGDDDDEYDDDEYDDEADDEGDDSDNVDHSNENIVHNGENNHSDGGGSGDGSGGEDSDSYGNAGLLQSGPLLGQSSTGNVFANSPAAQISLLTAPATLHNLLSMGAPLPTNGGLFGTFNAAPALHGLGGTAGTAGTAGIAGNAGITGPGPAPPPQECEPMHGSTIPRVARARVNLTALSQRYNLYFAVYQDKIHVYRPQPAPEILRGPQLILCPGPSSAAKTIGGYIDPKFPHQANHAIVGDLGSEEILLLGYDDGDVIAYYTRHICDYVERRSRRTHRSRRRQQQQHSCPPPLPPLKKPTPFFRQTVGISAWGLAIHAQSRLIAVSSNLFEVNVFAFALYPPAPARSSSSAATDRSRRFYQTKNVSSFASTSASAGGKPLSDLESLRLRDRNWRILLPLEATGHNMPCIAFIDDDNGDAEKVVGVDIHGKAWFLDIWKVGLNRALVMLPPNRGERLVGWGILPLPARAFVKSERMPSAPSQKQGANSTASQNISHLMTLTNENDPPALLSASAVVCDSQLGQESAEEHSSEDEDGSWGEENTADHDLVLPEDDGYDLFSHAQSSGDSEDESQYDFANEQGSNDAASSTSTSVSVSVSTSTSTNSENENEDSGGIRDTYGHYHCHDHHRLRGCRCRLDGQRNRHDFQLGSVICPSLSLVWSDLSTMKLITILRCAPHRQRMVKAVLLTGSEKTPDLLQMAERLSILRTFGTDAEFFTTSLEKPWGVFFSKMIEPPVAPNFVWDMTANYHRLSLLECIPEIGVVIVGGMFGRVAVLRLMRGSRSRARAGARASASSGASATAGMRRREKRRRGGAEEDPDDGSGSGSGSGNGNGSGDGETLHRCFRTEWILPRRLEEEKKLRPSCCLLGIAVSPVPEDGASPWGLASGKKRPQQEGSKPPRRWRLILHYMDHTILQYYIEEKRPGPRRRLCVFSP